METCISTSGADVTMWLSFLLFDPGISLTFHSGQSGFNSIFGSPLEQGKRESSENWKGLWQSGEEGVKDGTRLQKRLPDKKLNKL